MSINDSTATATPPQGFTPDTNSEDDDGQPTLWQDKSNDVHGILSIGSYWELDKGHCYTLSVVEVNRDYTIADLKAAYSELDQFIRRAEQVEGL